MKALDRCDSAARDPVEVLLRRIVDRALLGSLLTGAALAGCADEEPTGTSRDPSRADDDNVLVPEPIAPRDASMDASNTATQDAALDAPLDAVRDAANVQDALADAADDASKLPEGAYDPCVRGPGFPVRADGLTLAAPADYVAVRVASGSPPALDGGVEQWTASNFEVLSELGTPCASRGEECSAKVAHHPDALAQGTCEQLCSEWSIVTTRGDEVARWATPEQLQALLGALDSDDDAMMFVASHGYDIACPAPGANTLDDANLRYVLQLPEGRELVGVKYSDSCPVVLRRVRLLVTPSGALQERERIEYAVPEGATCAGRAPAGWHGAGGEVVSLASYLARCAELEAASVYAFDRLASELRAHGAPEALVERASSAARQEVRHAEVVAGLASRHGVRPRAPVIDVQPRRSLEDIARENAVEGCVRETYGALVGALQASRARDGSLREVMRNIAREEAGHAALSHDLHAWLMAQLSRDQQARVSRAARDAVDALAAACCEEPAPALSEAGLPDSALASVLVRELDAQLWSHAFAA